MNHAAAIGALICLAWSASVFAAEPVAEADNAKESGIGNRESTTEPASRDSRLPIPDSRSSGQKPAASSQSPAPASRRGDRLDLDTTIVTGNRELPKVLYIVPWKKADIGDLPAQPFNTLLDEALTPVDRDVFRREVTYYGAMSSGADTANPANAAPQSGPEK